jgi:hypothetical protein
MRNYLITSLFLILANCIFAQDPAPNYTFILNGNGEATTHLISSYWDYMPFGFNGHNVGKQEEISMPYGYSGGGFYIGYAWSSTPMINTDRRAICSYLNSDFTLYGSNCVGNAYVLSYESVPSVDIGPYTCDPFFSWYAIEETDGSKDCLMSYDMYHLTGATGYWKQPWIVLDNPELSEPFTGHGDDEFIDPVVWVGDSPLWNYSRVHVYANNSTNGNENVLYGFADFNSDDLLYESEFDWTYTTFPSLDHLAYNENILINKDLVVSDSQVAFIGSYGDTLFCLYSNDYGESFTMFKQEWLYEVDNPIQEDGQTYEFYNSDGFTPAELVFCLSNDGTNYNGVFSDSDSKILWMTGININTIDNIETGDYMPEYFYPKIFKFDIDSGSFSFYDMDIQGTDPGDDQPAIPWDLDENGIVDEFNDDGSVYIPLSMPSWFFNSELGYYDAFHYESNFKMSAAENWIVAVWHDSKKLHSAYLGHEGYDGWHQQPEIALSSSSDFGETWSEIRYINANSYDSVIDPNNHYEGNFAEEFADMLPVNVSLGEELEIIYNGQDNIQAILYLAFFDDYDYGSGVMDYEGCGDITGGSVKFSVLDIELPDTSQGEIEILIDPYRGLMNHPNPFNPTTTISFRISNEQNEQDKLPELVIYNIKGQKIKNLTNRLTHQLSNHYEVTWNGTDDNGKRVGSGIYFCRLSTENNVDFVKMVMLK